MAYNLWGLLMYDKKDALYETPKFINIGHIFGMSDDKKHLSF